MNLLSIIWDIDPIAFTLGPVTVRWYGVVYALGFLIGSTLILDKIFKNDKCPKDWADQVFIYMVLAVVVGARLGHVFFYDWAYYSEHLWEIPKVWHGGLASHGGAIAMIITAWAVSKYLMKKPFLWLSDRLFIASAFAAGFIRIANLMNSEIYGSVTTLPWGFQFVRDYPNVPIDMVPVCHPTQLYEALAYLLLSFFMMWLYWRKDAGQRLGLLTGIGFAGVFIARFFIEFIKNDQSDFEADMMLNMGQWLSVPFIILGIGLIVFSLRRPKTPADNMSNVKK